MASLQKVDFLTFCQVKFTPEDDVIARIYWDAILQCDNFDVNFKNVIDDVLDAWWKTELALYFLVTNNDYLRKVTDTNAVLLLGT